MDDASLVVGGGACPVCFGGADPAGGAASGGGAASETIPSSFELQGVHDLIETGEDGARGTCACLCGRRIGCGRS